MTYVRSAKARAKRRRSGWNLLLIPAVIAPLAALWVLGFEASNQIHGAIHPGEDLKSNASGIGPIVTTLALVFGALPLSFLIGNLFVRLIPSARRALDREAQGQPQSSFMEAQRALVKICGFVVPAAIAAWAIGIMMSWSA